MMIRRELPRVNMNNPQINAYVEAVQRAQKNFHVVSTDDGTWAVKQASSSKALKVFDKKTSAVSYAKKIAKKNTAELIIHKKDGRIQSRKMVLK